MKGDGIVETVRFERRIVEQNVSDGHPKRLRMRPLERRRGQDCFVPTCYRDANPESARERGPSPAIYLGRRDLLGERCQPRTGRQKETGR